MQDFLNSLSDQKTYSVLSVIRWINPHTGLSEGITLNMGQPPSFKITSKNSAYLLSSKLMLEINAALAKYGINAADSEILFMYKEWLDLSEFNSNLDKIRGLGLPHPKK